MSEMDNVKAALEAGKKIGELLAQGTVHRVTGDTKPFLLLPQGYTMQDMETHLPEPLAARSTVTLNDAESFVGYINRFKDADTVVFANLEDRKFEAVIDYHEAPYGEGADRASVKPRWGKHRAKFDCQTTPVWDEWTNEANDRKPKSQVDFARFIEEHIPHIARPAGGVLMEMCLNLEAKKDVQFRASTRLADGQHQFRYEETIQGQAGSQSGMVAIPDGFVVAVEPIRGVGLKAIDARFRYRISSGQLSMWYELVRPDDVLEAAFAELVTIMRQELGDTPVLAGCAPVIA